MIRHWLVLILLTAAWAFAGVKGASPDLGTRYSGWNVASFALEDGSEPDSAEDSPLAGLLGPLEGGLALHGREGFLGQRRPVYRPRLLEEDLRRIRLYLAREGFPEPALHPSFEADVEDRSIRVVVKVVPGRWVLVLDLAVEGLPQEAAFAADSLIEVERENRRYSDRRVQATAEVIAELCRESGYAKVTVDSRLHRRDPESVVLDYQVRPGERYRITELSVEGLAPDLVPLVERRLGGALGEVYSPRRLHEIREDLKDLEVLRQVQLQTEAIALAELRLVARLAARAYRVTSYSLGTWTDHPLRAKASWKHRNLFRRGRGFSIGGAWSPNQYEVETTAWWPSLPVSRSTSRLRLAYEAEREESYRADRSELSAAVALKPDRRNQWLFEVAASRVNVRSRAAAPDVFAEGAGELVTLALTRQGNFSDDLLDPRRGFRFRLRGEISPPGFLSDYPFLSAEAGARVYIHLLKPAVLAGRLVVGASEPFAGSERLLPYKRFFAGGNSSMRGYGRRKLGPRDAEGNPLGGEARVLSGAEVRFRLFSWFGMPLFLDGCQVWGRKSDLDFGDLEWAVGSGVIFYTPVGPVRLDLAYNINGEPIDRDDWALQFSIGHAY